jgi:phosphomannomutase
MSIIRSISGLRATIENFENNDLVNCYASAFSAISPDGPIVIGRDGRPSGMQIEKVLASCLKNLGREIILLGMVPTPTVQLFVEQMQAAGGIAITASHNPSEWNGLKFINATGVFLDADENKKLWDHVDNDSVSDNITNDIIYEYYPDPIALHINVILDLTIFKDGRSLEELRKRNFRVVVDAVNSSGSIAIPHLLKEFGCEIIPLYCDGSGIFPHTPEPLPQNLTELAKAVIQHKADIGIAVDPDADRLVLIDENGDPIGEEKTIVLAIDAVFDNFQKFNIKKRIAVVNHSTTMLVEYVAGQYGVEVQRSPVGEINVVKLMKHTGAIIGGEGSGGVIMPACHYGRDSLVGTALILYLLATENKSLSEKCLEYPKYSMKKDKMEFSGSLEPIITKVHSLFPEARILNDDGIKVIFEDSWVQLRKSNTEPIIRIIAESLSDEKTLELINSVKGLI